MSSLTPADRGRRRAARGAAPADPVRSAAPARHDIPADPHGPAPAAARGRRAAPADDGRPRRAPRSPRKRRFLVPAIAGTVLALSGGAAAAYSARTADRGIDLVAEHVNRTATAAATATADRPPRPRPGSLPGIVPDPGVTVPLPFDGLLPGGVGAPLLPTPPLPHLPHPGPFFGGIPGTTPEPSAPPAPRPPVMAKPRKAARPATKRAAGTPRRTERTTASRKPADRHTASGASGALNWSGLSRCESGGNPHAVDPSGHYYGLYQFSPSTWHSVGGRGLPSQASPAEQTSRARALLRRSGPGQWPVCGKNLYR